MTTKLCFISKPYKNAIENVRYNYKVSAPGSVRITGTVVPTWLRFYEGILSGKPGKNDIGSHSVILTATDEKNLSIRQLFTIIVENNAPQAINVPSRDVKQGYSITLNMNEYFFEDEDSELENFTISRVPKNGKAVINVDTGRLFYTAHSEGIDSLEVTVSDGIQTSKPSIINITVLPVKKKIEKTIYEMEEAAKNSGISTEQINKLKKVIPVDKITNGKATLPEDIKKTIRECIFKDGDLKNKKRRKAAIDLIFKKNADVKRFQVDKTDLDLPAEFKKSKVLIIKQGETLDMNELDDDEGLFSVLSAGEKICIITSTTIITITRPTDDDKYKVDVENGWTFDNIKPKNISGCDNFNMEDPGNDDNYLIPDDIISIDMQCFIIGSVASCAPLPPTPVPSGGDPYISPLYGPIYKLPDTHSIYRLYQHGNTFINVTVEEMDKTNEINKYYKNNPNLNSIIKEGYFFKHLFISVQNHKLIFNLNTFKWVTTKQSNKFFKIKLPKAERIQGAWIGTETVTKIPITWKNENNETIGINIFAFKDPQKENGISLINPNKEQSYGLLVRNYKPRLMTIKKLSSTKSVRNKVLKAKNKYTQKAIKKPGEVWLKY